MKTQLLYTSGCGIFEECEFELPDHPGPTDIFVQSLMTGVCRSDLDMMQGRFGILPLNMQGHEGLAQVIEVGSNVNDVEVGDIVATRGEPAYADYYYVREHEYIQVPVAEPKYILEPVACGINLILQSRKLLPSTRKPKKCLILGSGFLAWVAYHAIQIFDFLNFDITVVGNSNKELWKNLLSQDYTGTYDVVIDLSSRTDVFDNPILNNNSTVIMGTQKTVTTDFGNLLWKSCNMVFPSPRNPSFYTSMVLARDWIRDEKLIVDNFWTKGYNRRTNWRNAFKEGINRPANYSRGYIYWN